MWFQEEGDQIYLPIWLLWQGVRDATVYSFEKAVKDAKVFGFTEKDIENVSLPFEYGRRIRWWNRFTYAFMPMLQVLWNMTKGWWKF